MSKTATATLQTPWDCKWSRFGRMHGAQAHAEGLWVCVYPDGTRRPVDVAECETCPKWEYDPPAVAQGARPVAATTTDVHATSAVAACTQCGRGEKRLEAGVRVAALALAIVFAATGFVALTGPLTIPLTITLWFGAVSCFLLGIWGNFNRGSLPVRSW